MNVKQFSWILWLRFPALLTRITVSFSAFSSLRSPPLAAFISQAESSVAFHYKAFRRCWLFCRRIINPQRISQSLTLSGEANFIAPFWRKFFLAHRAYSCVHPVIIPQTAINTLPRTTSNRHNNRDNFHKWGITNGFTNSSTGHNDRGGYYLD